MGAVNGDERLPESQYGMSTASYYSTGAEGSPSDPGRLVDAAPAQVTVPFTNYQVDGSGGTAAVAQVTSPLAGERVDSTGAGMGSVSTPHHPGAGR